MGRLSCVQWNGTVEQSSQKRDHGEGSLTTSSSTSEQCLFDIQYTQELEMVEMRQRLLLETRSAFYKEGSCNAFCVTAR